MSERSGMQQPSSWASSLVLTSSASTTGHGNYGMRCRSLCRPIYWTVKVRYKCAESICLDHFRRDQGQEDGGHRTHDGHDDGRPDVGAGWQWHDGCPWNPETLQQVMVELDGEARMLLHQLPGQKQVELASFLQATIQDGTFMNPSGWTVKSCMVAGVRTQSILGGNPTA